MGQADRSIQSRRSFLKAMGLGAAALAWPGCTKSKSTPNIIFIQIDDLGWKDLGCMGSTFYETPNIDRLAAQGVLFTNAYAAAANCAPSRACFMSGQYTPRHGIYTVGSSERGDARTRKLIPVKNKTTLADEEITLAEALRGNGYATAHVGKWHLGRDARSQGFDVNIGGGVYGHPKSYFSPYQNDFLPDGPRDEYLPDRLTTEAMHFISAHKNRPFFLHLAYYSVHTPIQPKEEKQQKYLRKSPSNGQHHAGYAAMIESVDENIGRLLARLDDLNLAEDTIVFFTSDNGGVRRITSMAPLRAGKGSYYEGGIRVPLIVRWSKRIHAGTTCDAPVHGIDYYPTILELTDTKKPQGKILDGVSLVPLLTGTGDVEKRALYWHFPIYLQRGNDETRDPVFRTRPGSVIRYGDWKLHEYFEDGGLELYNLKDDIGEKDNLLDRHPEKAQALHDMLVAWRESVNAPTPTKLNPEYDAKLDSMRRKMH